MTIRLKDAAVWGDRVTPNRAIYAFLFCNYGCKSAICTGSLGPRAIWYIYHFYTHNCKTEMRIWPCLGWPCPPKLPRPKGGWSFYGNQNPVLPILWVTGPWVQGLFGTYSTFTPIIAEQKCVYGPVWGDPVPPNCRVLKADGHFTVARTLYYPYHEL